jgi:hypothetical protein
MAHTNQVFAKSVNEEVVNHYGAIRLHATGSASLVPTLLSLDGIYSFQLQSMDLQPRSNIVINKLSNFIQQEAQLELRTININETFQCNKIILFVRPVAKSYPE